MKSRFLAVLAALFGIGGVALVLTLLLSLALPTSAQAPGPLQVVVGHSIRNDTSPPLSAIRPAPLPQKLEPREIPRQPLPKAGRSKGSPEPAPGEVVDRNDWKAVATLPSPVMNFEGINNVNGVLPPDAQGDIGYDPATGKKYYIQWVNLSYAIWDVTVTPTLVLSPTNGKTLWAGFSGPCEASNDGDPITLFDTLAQRWLMSQFALPNYPNGPFYQCIAVSTSANPLGAWHRYAFLAHATKVNDYPKFGVWPDGYYMTVNQFNAGSLTWAGAGVFVFDRAAMLAGSPAAFQYLDLFDVNVDFGGMLPADLDGPILPPPGSPGYFAEVDDSTWISPVDALRIWQFDVDWSNPASSTFGIAGQPNATLATAEWSPLPCVAADSPNCIPQPGTSQKLDAIGDRLMHRLAYRNFGSHAALVVNHTVDAGAGRAGIRWYEIRNPGGAATIHQQSTFAPGDGDHRWTGSIAMDHDGNIALGYSAASTSTYPSIRYTGRLAGDPPNALPQGETTLVAGGGSQTHVAARWGDYSMMGIDPIDDCTFWFTAEYMQTTSLAGWRTRVGSFKFPSCSAGPRGALAGVVSDASNGSPIAGAVVTTSVVPTQTWGTLSGATGVYALFLPAGVYTLTAAHSNYLPASFGGVSIVSGTTTTQHIALTPLTPYVVSGTVRDAITGWPLYARLDMSGYLGGALWNDPATGVYSVTLAGGITYTFDVSAWVGGYITASRAVAPLIGSRTENFGLGVNPATCSAPGYELDAFGAACLPQAGGLVVGNAHDANTSAPLIGAQVSNDSGRSTLTGATEDPAVADSFYTLFSPAGSRVFTATRIGGYAPVVLRPTVIQSGTIRQDFRLPAGYLTYAPPGLQITLDMGASETLPFTLTNGGSLPATFELQEIARGFRPILIGPYHTAGDGVKPFEPSYALSGPFSGAGLENECGAIAQTVYQVESGETSSACALASDVPWLSEAPSVSGTLPASTSQPFVVVFDAGVPEVDQPGQYLAGMKIEENTPYSLTHVPVTMTINAPPDWGQAHGRVYSLGYCDVTPSLLTGATIDLTYGDGLTQTLTHGGEPWSWWAPAGPITITASAPGHLTQTVTADIPAGQGVNQDIDLRWLHSCGGVSPLPIDVRLPPNSRTSVPVNLINRGALPWAWSLAENASWLSITGPINGVTSPDSSIPSELVIDTAGMPIGATHTAVVDVAHDDDRLPNPLPLLVRVTVTNYRLYLPAVRKAPA